MCDLSTGACPGVNILISVWIIDQLLPELRGDPKPVNNQDSPGRRGDQAQG